MPKMKVAVVTKNTDFLFEVIGTLLIIFSLILIGRLGPSGEILAICFKIIFGDFSVLILAFIFFLGVYFIYKKKIFDFKNISFLGGALCYLGLSLYCHMALYKEMDMTQKNVIVKTFDLYKNYFNLKDSSYVFGGGAIGCLLFQLIVIMFGTVGIIILGIVLIVIGVSFLLQTHILDLLIKNSFIKTTIKKFFYSIFYYFKNIKITKTKVEHTKVFSLSILNDTKREDNLIIQSELNKEQLENFNLYSVNYKLPIIVNTYYTGYTCTRYLVDKTIDYSFNSIKGKISSFFNDNALFMENRESLIIDVPNRFKELLTLKKTLKNVNNEVICYGYSVDMKLIYLNNLAEGNIFFGAVDSGISNLIKGIVFQIFLNNQTNNYTFFYDRRDTFKNLYGLKTDYFFYSKNENDAIVALDDAFREYERRNELLKYLNVNSISEANTEIKNNHNKISPIINEYYFINTDLTNETSDFIEKLNYLMKLSSKCGIYVFVINRLKEELEYLNIQNASLLLFYSDSITTSVKLLGNENLCYLQKKGDFIYKNNTNVIHGQTPFISEADYLYFVKRLIS